MSGATKRPDALNVTLNKTAELYGPSCGYAFIRLPILSSSLVQYPGRSHFHVLDRELCHKMSGTFSLFKRLTV